MDKIKNTIVKILATWVAIGTSLVVIGNVGFIDIPTELLQMFSGDVADALQAAFDSIFVAIGYILNVAQLIRAIFISKDTTGQVNVLSESKLNSIKWSPFKV